MRPAGSAGGADRAGLVIGALLVLVALVIIEQTYFTTYSPGYEKIGPKAFPFAIAFGLACLGFQTGIRALQGLDRHEQHDWRLFKPAGWLVAGLLAQIFLLMVGAGFCLATGALFGLVARGFGACPLWLALAVGVLVSIVAYVAFHFGLKLSLPVGPIEHRLG